MLLPVYVNVDDTLRTWPIVDFGRPTLASKQAMLYKMTLKRLPVQLQSTSACSNHASDHNMIHDHVTQVTTDRQLGIKFSKYWKFASTVRGTTRLRVDFSVHVHAARVRHGARGRGACQTWHAHGHR